MNSGASGERLDGDVNSLSGVGFGAGADILGDGWEVARGEW